jgi:hypothetical protein
MRPVRLLAAGTAGSLIGGLFMLGAPLAGAAEAIPAACPAGTNHATTIGSDDFDPGTTEELPWTQDPAGSWTLTDAEDDYLHGSTPAEADAAKSTGLLNGWLEADKTTVLVVSHSYDFGDDAVNPHDRGVAEIAVGDTWHELATYSSTGAKATNEYDLTQWAGEEDVSVRFRIVGDGTPPATAGHGWSLYDVAFVRCDAAQPPSAPTSVTATGGLGTATVKWQPPATPGVAPLDGYTVTVNPGGQTYDVGPDVTSKSITGLSNGTTYTFSVTAKNVAGTSPAASKKLVGTKIYSSAPKVITYGSSAKISGKAVREDTGAGLYNHTVKLQARKNGTTTWSTLAYAKTTSGGAYSFTRKPTSNYDFRVVYSSGNGSYLGSMSAERTVLVRTKVTAAFSDSTIRVGQVVRYAGSVSPKHSWQTVYVQYYIDGQWITDPEFSAKLNSESKYALYMEAYETGTYRFRTYKPADSDHAAGYSPTQKVVVS